MFIINILMFLVKAGLTFVAIFAVVALLAALNIVDAIGNFI